MWSYYGSKTKIVHLYPKPIHDKIIEPFAGAAKYSLKYFDREVLLIDKSIPIVKIWEFLINDCTESDIKKLPKVNKGDRILRETFDHEGLYLLMRFLIVQGAFGGNNVVSKWGAARFENNRKNILTNLHKVRHWQVRLGDYQDSPEINATWFVDPPYTVGGHKYPQSNKNIDYNHLSLWCKSRKGQVITCENTGGNWLPFKPLTSIWGVKGKTNEVIWTNYPTHYDNEQGSLF